MEALSSIFPQNSDGVYDLQGDVVKKSLASNNNKVELYKVVNIEKC